MTSDEVLARMRAGGLALLFDTNALYGNRRFFALCERVNRLNGKRSGDGRIRMLVPAVAHAEKLLDLKQEYKEKYDEEVIIRGLARKGLEIFPFETRHALRMATLLGTAFPNTEGWRRAKRDMCLECLGIAEKIDALGIELGPGKRCGATIDWLIAAQAVEEGHVLVTDDRGVEFKQVSDKVRLETLEQAIGKLLEDAEGPAQGSDAH